MANMCYEIYATCTQHSLWLNFDKKYAELFEHMCSVGKAFSFINKRVPFLNWLYSGELLVRKATACYAYIVASLDIQLQQSLFMLNVDTLMQVPLKVCWNIVLLYHTSITLDIQCFDRQAALKGHAFWSKVLLL